MFRLWMWFCPADHLYHPGLFRVFGNRLEPISILKEGHMTRIIADTTSCLDPVFASTYDIPVIPQVINFGNESFIEGVDIDHATFIQKLRASPTLPKTAAPPPGLFIEAFRRFVPTGEPILCIHPSSDVSGTVRSALTAKAEFPEADIRVLDTRLVASPLGTLVEQAARWNQAGRTIDEIQADLNAMIPRCKIYFLVATLEYLAKGGRIGGATALLGSLLQIKPILTFVDGRVDQFEKERTMKHAVTRLKELVITQYPTRGEGFLSIMHAGVPDQGQALADDLKSALKLETVPIVDVPPAIVSNGGPGILGVGFFINP